MKYPIGIQDFGKIRNDKGGSITKLFIRYKIGFSLIIGFQYICDYLHLVHQFFRNIFAGKFKYSIETMLTDTCGCVQ